LDTICAEYFYEVQGKVTEADRRGKDWKEDEDMNCSETMKCTCSMTFCLVIWIINTFRRVQCNKFHLELSACAKLKFT
jgi:hypothetical protein